MAAVIKKLKNKEKAKCQVYIHQQHVSHGCQRGIKQSMYTLSENVHSSIIMGGECRAESNVRGEGSRLSAGEEVHQKSKDDLHSPAAYGLLDQPKNPSERASNLNLPRADPRLSPWQDFPDFPTRLA